MGVCEDRYADVLRRLNDVLVDRVILAIASPIQISISVPSAPTLYLKANQRYEIRHPSLMAIEAFSGAAAITAAHCERHSSRILE